MDKPFNQLPSLHIVLSVLLADFYAKRTRGPLRASILIWFALISASTLFTYQHHFVDIIGGALVGGIFLFLFADRSKLWQSGTLRFSGLYASAGLFLALAAGVKGGFAYLLLWPSVSLLLTSYSYLKSNAQYFPKFFLRAPKFASLLFLPVTLGHRLSHLYYAKFYRNRTSAWSELTENVWIGRALFDQESKFALAQGVCAVVDLSGELDENKHFKKVPVLKLPILDLTAPKRAQIMSAIDFINAHQGNGIVYVHCKAGYSRTASVAGCWLMESGRAKDADDAMNFLKASRPGMIIRAEAETAMREWSCM